MTRVYITRKIPKEAFELLKRNKIKVKVYPKDKPIPQDILRKEGSKADGIISLLTDKISSETIEQFNSCRIIANYAVGYNNIDIAAAEKKGIWVTNTPDILTDATADITISLLLACARRITEGERFMRAGKFKGWEAELLLGYDLKNKYFGIIGAGRIGTAAALRAHAFQCKILYSSIKENEELELETGAEKVSLEVLLTRSDFISLHLPLKEDTYHLLNKEKLELLKSSAILINTSRGEIVDEKYLIKMLKKKRIAAAGFDVYEGEPKVNPALLKLKNAVLLPHLGSATVETRREMALLCASNILAIFAGRQPLTPVNKPNILTDFTQ